jgi:hypothetical protein
MRSLLICATHMHEHMHAKAVLLCAISLCVLVTAAGCLAGPYVSVKPEDESTQVVSVHDVDLSILNVTSTLKHNTGPGLITYNLCVTNIDRQDYTIQGNGFQLLTNNSDVLLPVIGQNNSTSFLTYNHTYPGDHVTGNVTFYVPQDESPWIVRYVDTSISVGVNVTQPKST